MGKEVFVSLENIDIFIKILADIIKATRLKINIIIFISFVLIKVLLDINNYDTNNFTKIYVIKVLIELSLN